MVLTQTGEAQSRTGLRPMDPGRDLAAVANLIAHSFADDLDARAQAVLRSMRWMARLGPLVWWLSVADPEFKESFTGFVWEEMDPQRWRPQIVGNASLNRAPGNRRRWIVCNVAVRPEWRRQGIARSLTQAAIAEARSLEADGVVLQAYQENGAAVRLYAGLGFQEVAGETSLRLAAPAPLPLQEAPGYTLKSGRAARGQAAYDLVRQVLPLAFQWMEPIRPERYRLGAWELLAQGLGDSAAGRRTHRIGAWQADSLVGLLILEAAFRQPAHHIKLFVLGRHRGRVEAALLNYALRLLATLPPKPVWAVVDKTHTAALDALRSLGFEERRTLVVMTKDLI